MKKLIALFALAASAWAAPFNIVADITATSNIITIQNKSGAGLARRAQGQVMNVFCSVDCVVDIYSGGSAPTGTLDNTLVGKDENQNAPIGLDVYKASDSTGGSLRSRHYIKAGGILPVPMKTMTLKGVFGSRHTISITFPGGGSNRSILNYWIDEF